MNSTGQYQGHHILEAMHAAPRYADAIFREILKLSPGRSSRILDFGAGDGMFAAKFYGAGFSVDCVEPDPSLRKSLPGKQFEDTRSIPAESYDLVYSINVLEHVGDLDAVCRELRRALKRDGALFIFVPAFELIWTSLDDQVRHNRRFTKATLKRALSKAGFEVAELRYFDSLGFISALLIRFIETIRSFPYNSETVGFYDRFVFPASRMLDSVGKYVIGKNLIATAV